jgi:ribosomal protein S18 acetylase RimI-like enzyme
MIRPVTPADSPALLALSEGTGFFHPSEIETLEGVLCDLFEHAHHFGHQCVAWDEGNGPVGYVYFAPEEMTDRTWYVWWLAVAADRQNRGIGRKLLAFAESAVRDAGGRLLVIETSATPKYEPTRQFYLRCGYTAAAVIPDLYADGDGMAVFLKRVRSEE